MRVTKALLGDDALRANGDGVIALVVEEDLIRIAVPIRPSLTEPIHISGPRDALTE